MDAALRFGSQSAGDIPPKGPISAEFTLESTLSSPAVLSVYLQTRRSLTRSSSCMLTFCSPVYLISLNKSSINTDWWRNSRGNCVHLQAAVMHIQINSNPFTQAPHLHMFLHSTAVRASSVCQHLIATQSPPCTSSHRTCSVCTGKTSFFFERCTV